MKFNYKSSLVTGLCIATFLAGTSVSHAITCNGPYQTLKNGRDIASPYCEDLYLAYVARAHGVKVTNREIRNNPNRKEEVCEVVGHDNRVSDICNEVRQNQFKSK